MTQSSVDTAPAIHHLITEDDTPVDNLPSEKQQRLLTEPLYSVWAGPGDGRPFLAAANVGVFYQARNPAIVPDMFLSLDVQVADDWWQKEHRSYFLWEFGKPPELVLEIVSNREGGEDDNKKRIYERMHVNYYVIYDPLQQIMADVLTVYRRHDTGYTRMELPLFPLLKLGLTLWEGTFEDKHDTWLRWTDEHGRLIPTGKERADQAEARAAQAALQVQQATLQAEQATLQAEQATLQAEQATLQAEQANASA
ncbi:MAG: Uma2 family endonuclease, partial [Candidatus Tectomicrobia bacterium]|nr:Uma2 family endonuclease [Candidatus Tectomicrobia bacterium]